MLIISLEGVRAGAGRRRGHVYNLTAKEAEASEEVVASKILVHSIPVLSLFDFGASHCFISSRFITLHYIPLEDTENQWEISTGNGVVTTNKVCKAYTVELCGMKLEAGLFILDTGYDVILGITWFSKYSAVIDCQDKKVTFRISHQSEFQFN